jgi:hypothetical protein
MKTASNRPVAPPSTRANSSTGSAKLLLRAPIERPYVHHVICVVLCVVCCVSRDTCCVLCVVVLLCCVLLCCLWIVDCGL